MSHTQYYISNQSYSDVVYDENIPLQNNSTLGNLTYNQEYDQYYVPVVSSNLLYSLYLNIEKDNKLNYFVYDVFNSNELYLPEPIPGYAYEINDKNRLNFLRLFYSNFDSENYNSNLIKFISDKIFEVGGSYTAPITNFSIRIIDRNGNPAIYLLVEDFFTLTKISESSQAKNNSLHVCEHLTIQNSSHVLTSQSYPYANSVENIPICSNPSFHKNSNEHPHVCSYYAFSALNLEVNTFKDCSGYSPVKETIIDKELHLNSNSTPVRISLFKSPCLDGNESYVVHNHTENVDIFTVDSSSIDKDNLNLDSFFEEIITCYESNNIKPFEDNSNDSHKSYLSQLVKG
jgi:hypothetical protein